VDFFSGWKEVYMLLILEKEGAWVSSVIIDTYALILGTKSNDNCPSGHLYIAPNLIDLPQY